MADGTPTNLASIFFSHCAKNLVILLGRCQIALPTRTVGFDLKYKKIIKNKRCCHNRHGSVSCSTLEQSQHALLWQVSTDSQRDAPPDPHPSTAAAHQCQATTSRIGGSRNEEVYAEDSPPFITALQPIPFRLGRHRNKVQLSLTT